MRFETLRDAVAALMDRFPPRVRDDLRSDDEHRQLQAELELAAAITPLLLPSLSEQKALNTGAHADSISCRGFP